MEINLSRLTFGNYLFSFNQFKQAIDYHNCLLEKLLPEHKDRFSISRNTELIYAMNNSKNSADKSYSDALKCAKPISSVSVIDESDDQSYTQFPITYMNLPKTAAHHSTLFGNITDVYFNTNQYELALEYDKKALESSTEPLCHSYYQQMIMTIKKHV